MTQFKLGGWKPDAQQPRDPGVLRHPDLWFDENLHIIQAHAASVSNPGQETDGVLDLRQWCSPIENQSQAASCVGNGTVGALEFLQIRNGQQLVDLSRLFVYYNARLMNRDQDKDGGSYIRLAFGTLSSLGTCSEAKWAYDLGKLFIRPSWGAYREAFVNKTSSYYRIDGSGQPRIDAIKRALQMQHPVVFGMTVDKVYMETGPDGLVAMPTASREGAGGHCQVIVGYDDNTQRLIVRNSWGTGWGDAGYGYVPYAYLDASAADDFWVPSLAVGLIMAVIDEYVRIVIAELALDRKFLARLRHGVTPAISSRGNRAVQAWLADMVTFGEELSPSQKRDVMSFAADRYSRIRGKVDSEQQADRELQRLLDLRFSSLKQVKEK